MASLDNLGCYDNSDKSKLPALNGTCIDKGWYQCNSTFNQTWCKHPSSGSLVLSNVSGSCQHLDWTEKYSDGSLRNKSWAIYITKQNQTVCLHPDNRCNMVPHPLCKDGEDEKQCKNEYVKKRKILEYADFECESPHHNKNTSTASVTIYTTACDGFEECFGGIDEQNCKVSMPTYVLFGKFMMLLWIVCHLTYIGNFVSIFPDISTFVP